MGRIKPRTVSELMDIAGSQMAKTRVIIRGRDHQKMTGGTDTVAKGEDPTTMTTTALIVK
jgi:hypothetical protein